jgi:hypothetical protein
VEGRSGWAAAGRWRVEQSVAGQWVGPAASGGGWTVCGGPNEEWGGDTTKVGVATVVKSSQHEGLSACSGLGQFRKIGVLA